MVEILHAVIVRVTRIMRAGERLRDQKARPNNVHLILDRGSPLWTCRGHPSLILLCRRTRKKVLTPGEQDSKVDQ